MLVLSRQSQCQAKIRHASLAEALDRAAEIMATDLTPDPRGPLTAYKCPHGIDPHWHVGHELPAVFASPRLDPEGARKLRNARTTRRRLRREFDKESNPDQAARLFRLLGELDDRIATLNGRGNPLERPKS